MRPDFLDEAIGRHVMGWNKIPATWSPCSSTNDLMQVLNRLKEQGVHYVLTGAGKGFRCELRWGNPLVACVADGIPLGVAVCQAALDCVGYPDSPFPKDVWVQEEVPEYIHCIRYCAETDAPGVRKSWCGVEGRSVFFQDIDHAVHNAENGGRLVACPECVSIIVKHLQGA